MRRQNQEIFQTALERLKQDFKLLQEFIDTGNLSEARGASLAMGSRGHGKPRRGIAITAGGPTLMAHAWVTLSVLRNVLNCDLPVEIVHNGQQEVREEARRDFLAAFKGVKFVDGEKVQLPAHQVSVQEDKTRQSNTLGFSLKVLAICYATSFDQVLLLDADALPLRDPTYLFDSPEFQRHGSLFFPDWWGHDGVSTLGVRSQAYEVFKLKPPWETSNHFLATESGALFLDRRRHALVLECLMFLNTHPTIFYSLMHGDKDTYRLAFAMIQNPHFYQVQTPARAALDSSFLSDEDGFLHHAGMMQHDPSGRLWLLHRTAEAKVQLMNPRFPNPDVLTVPLNERRAKKLMGGGRGLGYNLDQVDLDLWQRCASAYRDSYAWVAGCDSDVVTGGVPAPALPMAAYPDVLPPLLAAQQLFHNITRTANSTQSWKGWSLA